MIKERQLFDYCTFGQNYVIMRKENQLDYLSQVIKAANSGKPIPTEPEWNQWTHERMGITHCLECLKLDGCWFAKGKLHGGLITRFATVF